MDAESLRAEYDDSTEDEHRSCVYRQLEWLRVSMKRKPGWTAITYKDLFGEWPPRWMKTLVPMEACSAVQKAIRRRDNAFKREKKQERKACKTSSTDGNAASSSA